MLELYPNNVVVIDNFSYTPLNWLFNM